MRRLIYTAKNAIHKTPWLYDFLYHSITYNRDYAQQQRDRHLYPSKFGGMWTDRSDFEESLSARSAKEDLTTDDVNRLREWSQYGYVAMPGLITDQQIDAYEKEVAALKSQDSCPLLITAGDALTPVPYSPQTADKYNSVRTVDEYFYCSSALDILLQPQIKNFVELVLEADPLLTQSLHFDHGSQQPLHQDTAFVRMTSPMKLVGVWVALEDIKPGSGELLYLPGSHRWEGVLFSNRFKHYDKDRDGVEQLDNWHQWILDEAERRGVEPVTFRAKKGDVLFWHAALAHGGAPITDPGQTRKSLVAHYCPTNVRPLYHFYKPGQRKVYRDRRGAFTTSYYR